MLARGQVAVTPAAFQLPSLCILHLDLQPARPLRPYAARQPAAESLRGRGVDSSLPSAACTRTGPFSGVCCPGSRGNRSPEGRLVRGDRGCCLFLGVLWTQVLRRTRRGVWHQALPRLVVSLVQAFPLPGP